MENPSHVGRSAWRRLCAASGAFGRILAGNEYASRSYAQYGEDMVLKAIFARYPGNYRGCYVDVGAHHPMRFSNTRFFYERGWSGICVDPLPGTATLFARWRPRDVFLQAGVAETEGTMTYFMFSEPALNTFSEKIAGESAHGVTARAEVRMYPLRRILADHLLAGREIDFLSVDVEGLGLQVLRSNDWAHYRPRVVLVEETAAATLAEVENLEEAIFMKRQDYRAFARCPSGLFFVDTRSPAYEGGGHLRFPS